MNKIRKAGIAILFLFSLVAVSFTSRIHADKIKSQIVGTNDFEVKRSILQLYK